MKMLLKAVAMSAATLSMGACATITRGHDTSWEVRTTPPGASVDTTNAMHCDSTPCSLKMARNSEFDATIAKAGFKSVKVHVSHKISGGGGAGMAGNVLLGGIIGAGVDVATGAMYDLTPNPVDLVLEKNNVAGAVSPRAAQPAQAAAATSALTAPSPARAAASPSR